MTHLPSLVSLGAVVGRCKPNGTKNELECFDEWFASVARAIQAQDESRNMNTILFISTGEGELELQASIMLKDLYTHLEELPIAKFIGRIKFQNGKL